MSARICVVGSGGREHALAQVLGRSGSVVVTPGNPGIPGSTDQPPAGTSPVSVSGSCAGQASTAASAAGLGNCTIGRGAGAGVWLPGPVPTHPTQASITATPNFFIPAECHSWEVRSPSAGSEVRLGA